MSSPEFTVKPMTVVQKLSDLPHRGATTQWERRAADILQDQLESIGASVERQRFRTAKTYIGEVWWLVGGLSAGLLLVSHASWFAFGLVAVCTVMALFYFDWRPSPSALLPPRAASENVIGKYPPSESRGENGGKSAQKKKLILMAHYDSAPVSLLYLPSMVKNFRQSLLVSLSLMVVAVILALLGTLGIGEPVIKWLCRAMAVYFLIQCLISTIDYVRMGFTNGAADNATGTAVAVATAERLWKNPLPDWEVEVVLTGAEEVGMKGARYYFLSHKKDLASRPAFVLNFDNLGSGDLKIIVRTGSISNVVYDNPLVDAAIEVATSDSRFARIGTGVWHTGDFDSVWFERSGINSLTLSAQNEKGQIPNLHRPEDTIENVDPLLPDFAVDFAESIARHLSKTT